ncbi:MAG: CbtA family protein [Pseudomonadota bacterium]|nr:CbtA family protein [Pseudomonadota bacterium]
MLTRILMSALIAGIIAGSLVAAVQSFTTTPLIIEAEHYEGGAEVETASIDASLILAHMAGAPGHHASEGAEAWAPDDGLERTIYTSIATIGTGVGFALVLLSVMVLSGAEITAKTGLAWGAAAFVATGLAPALGLSPELPGSAAAALEARQLWWAGTALATALALWLMLRVSSPLAIAIGVALIVAPHMIGAPHPSEYTSQVPGELSGHFASASLVAQALCWALVGSIAGFVWQRQASGSQAA